MTAVPNPPRGSYREWVVDADRRHREPLVDGDGFNVDPDGTVHADPVLVNRVRAEREPDVDALRAEREPDLDKLIAERDGGRR